MISSPLEESAAKSTQIQHDRAQMSSTNRVYTMPQIATNGHKTIIYYHKTLVEKQANFIKHEWRYNLGAYTRPYVSTSTIKLRAFGYQEDIEAIPKDNRFPLSTVIFQSPDSINFWTVLISTVLVFGGIPRTKELIAPFILNVLVGFIVAVITTLQESNS